MSQYLKNLDLVTHERHYGKLRSLGLDAEDTWTNLEKT